MVSIEFHFHDDVLTFSATKGVAADGEHGEDADGEHGADADGANGDGGGHGGATLAALALLALLVAVAWRLRGGDEDAVSAK
ncbi:MAG: hypothetical protein ABEJ08_05825 [Halobacteriaceae archaeon]